jgi:dTDP-glucose pyrophosphorylase
MRINLIPMAGEGQRFKDAGYTTPKPLLDINGKPMVVSAANSLPPADRYIFVCRTSHLETTDLKRTLESHFRDPVIIPVDKLTEGQAITCMLARDYIPDEATLTIGASDNDMTYDHSVTERLMNDESIDGCIWTFRNNAAVMQNPKMYGWVAKEEDSDLAKYVSCKVPISNDPMHDHAIIGAFTFRKAAFFFEAVEAMVKANSRINNEFYVDVAADFAIKAGNRMRVCEVDQYICWGTPKDYEEYLYWLHYFKQRI